VPPSLPVSKLTKFRSTHQLNTKFEVLATCKTTCARVSRMTLPCEFQCSKIWPYSGYSYRWHDTSPPFHTHRYTSRYQGPGIDVLQEVGVRIDLSSSHCTLCLPKARLHSQCVRQWGFKFTKITKEGALFANLFTGEQTMLTVCECHTPRLKAPTIYV
jgi:hypothetical protein